MSYNLKPAKTFEEQLELLKTRRMEIADDAKAIKALRHINYYRFTGYAFLFQKVNGQYKVSMARVLRIMEFDAEMRKLLLRYLEYIELHMRTQIAYWFAHAHGRDGGAHYDAKNFVREDFHADYLCSLAKQIDRNKNQPFVQHHIVAFGGKMPIWCAVEILSFSALSKLYSNMLPQDKDLIAANVDTDAAHLNNWLHCFSVLRNSCAHYARLYCNELTPNISLDRATLRQQSELKTNTLFAYLIAMLRLIPDAAMKAALVDDLKRLIAAYNQDISLADVSFPDNWEKILRDEKVICLKKVSEDKKIIPDIPQEKEES